MIGMYTVILALTFAEPSHLAVIQAAPEFALTTQAGTRLRSADLKGKVLLVSFIFTTCNGTCPATTATLARVQRALRDARLWGEDVAFVSISIDPTRDTPEVLAGYARSFGADPAAWHFLTGPPERVARVIAAWGMWAKVGRVQPKAS